MKLINSNPYRIAGLLSNSNEREITKQKSKIIKFTSVGKEIKSEYDFTFLETVNRSTENVDKAFSAIEQSQGKVNHSLFWFLKVNAFDETALNHLIAGNNEKAEELWSKVTEDKEITSKNYSCFNNLGTLLLISNDKTKIKKGLKLKLKLIQSNQFENYVDSVSDKTYKIDKKSQSETFIKELYSDLKIKISKAEIFKLFEGVEKNNYKIIQNLVSEDSFIKIEESISLLKKEQKFKPSFLKSALKINFEIKNELEFLKIIFNSNNILFQNISNKYSDVIHQGIINVINFYNDNITEIKTDYNFNNTKKDILKLLEISNHFSTNEATKENINETFDFVKDWSFSEDEFIVDFLFERIQKFNGKNISSGMKLLNDCIPKLKSLSKEHKHYLDLSSGLSNIIMKIVIKETNSVSNKLEKIFSYE